MAEGVEIVGLPRSTQKYFCYSCSREVTATHPDLTCTRCQSDFIEEVSSHNDGSDDSDLDFEPIVEAQYIAQEDPFRRLVRGMIGQTILEIDESGSLNTPTRTLLREWLRFYGRNESPESGPAVAEEDDVVDVDLNFFRELLFVSNLGDYAVGPEWDSIITQILNESEGSGPPPLAKKEIDALPLISVQRDLIIKGAQCTVCMEDFILHEKVIHLTCDHVYHPQCIIPWLERHATCPICRKQINESNQEETASGCQRMEECESSSSTSTTSNSESTSDTSTSSRQSSSALSSPTGSSVDLSSFVVHLPRDI